MGAGSEPSIHDVGCDHDAIACVLAVEVVANFVRNDRPARTEPGGDASFVPVSSADDAKPSLSNNTGGVAPGDEMPKTGSCGLGFSPVAKRLQLVADGNTAGTVPSLSSLDSVEDDVLE